LVQTPPQLRSPGGQPPVPLPPRLSVAQPPPKQICPDGQTLPHDPQLLASVLRLTHVMPQSVWPVSQSGQHTPPWQQPLTQTLPHVPQ
jgi:hypothetical protein